MDTQAPVGRMVREADTWSLRNLVEVAQKELASREEKSQVGAGKIRSIPSDAYRPMSDAELLTHIFTYHDDPNKVPNYTAIRTAGKHFAEVVLQNVKPCADRTEALRMVRLAVLWANAALALDGVSF